jgi:WD40 repeat protein
LSLLTFRGRTDAVWHVASSPDGKRIASRSNDNTVKMWGAATGEEILTLRLPAGP